MAVRQSESSLRRSPLSVLGALALLSALALAGCESDTLYEPTGPDPDPGNGTPPPPSQAGIDVRITVDARDRIELTDSIQVDLRGFDPTGVSGVGRLGYTLVVTLEDGSQAAVTNEIEVPSGPAGDTVTARFRVAPTWLSAARVPDAFEIQAYGYAINRANRCAAAVPELEQDADPLGCTMTTVQSQSYRIADARATPVPVLAVAGRTTLFPSSSIVVGDLAVDPNRARLYVSNRQDNVLHVFHPSEHRWNGTVSVGSEPWGLHLNRTGDTLLVANSGGTSISHVALSDAGAQEVVSRRLQTRNTALWELRLEDDGVDEDEENGEDPIRRVESFRVFDFSDRPQFVAQDAAGRILYSTRPTDTAPLGTVRWSENRAGWTEPETRILVRLGFGPVREELDLIREDDSMVIAHADSVIVFFDGDIEIFDHSPGAPGQVLRSGKAPPVEAAVRMLQNPQSDVEAFLEAAWNLEAVGFGDTTYVAASADREYVAFGDGGARVQDEQGDFVEAPGKVVVWHAGSATLSSRLSVEDLVHNASERVRALQLNGDGSLGVARGNFGTYFFSTDLRLRGTVPEAFPGGGGAALHPSHPNTAAPPASSTSTLAFTVSGDRDLRILDTVHYRDRGRIPIRDAIAGPMRVTGPLASDNGGQGANCTGPDCIVAKVYAVTEAGGLLVVDVRASQIQAAP